MMKNSTIVTGLLVIAMASGCASINSSMKPSEKISQWSPLTRAKQKKENKKAVPPPESMAVIWKDNTFRGESGIVVRGFEGRVSFHNAKNEPVKADGDLIIYGFDDSDSTSANKSRTPQKKFVITAEELESNYMETHLGPSYRVWVPWEPVGGYRKSINLIPIFRTPDGQIVRAGSSINVLPGKSAVADAEKKKDSTKNSKVAQVGFAGKDASGAHQADQAFMQEENYNQARMTTTTIPLVPTMASRLSLPQSDSGQRQGQNLDRKQGSESANGLPIQKSSKNSSLNESEGGVTSNSGTLAPTSINSQKSQGRAVFGQPGSMP